MKKWLENNIISSLTLGAIVAAAILYGKNEGRLFTSIENRVETEKFMDEKPSAAEEKIRIFLDSINAVDVMRSRKKRDSILTVILHNQNYQDSINVLNADQIFQIKQELRGEQKE